MKQKILYSEQLYFLFDYNKLSLVRYDDAIKDVIAASLLNEQVKNFDEFYRKSYNWDVIVLLTNDRSFTEIKGVSMVRYWKYEIPKERKKKFIENFL